MMLERVGEKGQRFAGKAVDRQGPNTAIILPRSVNEIERPPFVHAGNAGRRLAASNATRRFLRLST